MKPFELLRYLKKWKYLIVLVCAMGCLLVLMYESKQQQYTARAYIKYTHSLASEGLNPDSTALDPSEMLSASIITDVIDQLGLSVSVESLRSCISVEQIIPSEEAARKEAANQKNEDYEYHPTTVRVSVTVDHTRTRDFARSVLDALLSNYFEYYCEKYVDYALFPNNAANLSVDNYEFVDTAVILETTVQEIIDYLNARAASYPYFLSAQTGFSFSDLKNCYQYVMDNQVLDLYVYILNNHLVWDHDLLMRRYEKAVALNEIEMASNQEHIDDAWDIIVHFGDKTLHGNTNVAYTTGSVEEEATNIIWGDIEGYRSSEIVRTQTTYDTLVFQYASLRASQIDMQENQKRYQQILDTYQNVTTDTSEDSAKVEYVAEQLEKILSDLERLYGIFVTTIKEFNGVQGAKNISVLSSITTSQAINIKLYLVLAVVFFTAVGVAFAALLGRAGDFIYYAIYCDKLTGLQNRRSCDDFINARVHLPLPDNYGCVVFKLALRYPQRSDYTREAGDMALEYLGQYIRKQMDVMDFKGYNDNGVFLLLSGNCSEAKARDYCDILDNGIHTYALSAGFPFEYSIGSATSTEAGVFNIRKLIGTAMSSMTDYKSHLPQEEAPDENEATEGAEDDHA